MDVYESEIAQAERLIDSAFGKLLATINDYRQTHNLEPAQVTPEVNANKRKVTSLYRLYIGKNSNYCGNMQQMINILHDAAQSVIRIQKEELKQKKAAETAKALLKSQESEGTAKEVGEANE